MGRPLVVGSVHENVTAVEPEVCVTLGAAGSAGTSAATIENVLLTGPLPCTFTGVTTNVYSVPVVSPLIVTVVPEVTDVVLVYEVPAQLLCPTV